MNKIIAKPKISASELLAYLFCTVFVGGVLAEPLIVIHEHLAPTSLSQSIRNVYLGIGFLLAAGATIYWLKRCKWRYTWTLTDKLLIQGTHNTVAIPLSAITSIAVGIPSSSIFSRMLNEVYQSSLVINRNDSQMMAFNIHVCNNGTSLMESLISRLPNVVDQHKNFTPQEIRALRRPKWNKWVRVS